MKRIAFIHFILLLCLFSGCTPVSEMETLTDTPSKASAETQVLEQGYEKLNFPTSHIDLNEAGLEHEGEQTTFYLTYTWHNDSSESRSFTQMYTDFKVEQYPNGDFENSQGTEL